MVGKTKNNLSRPTHTLRPPHQPLQHLRCSTHIAILALIVTFFSSHFSRQLHSIEERPTNSSGGHLHKVAGFSSSTTPRHHRPALDLSIFRVLLHLRLLNDAHDSSYGLISICYFIPPWRFRKKVDPSKMEANASFWVLSAVHSLWAYSSKGHGHPLRLEASCILYYY
jgi:hypothetical protein